jgi:hypothetical protein
MSRSCETFYETCIRRAVSPLRLSFLDHPSPGVPVQNLYLETELGSVDILTSILGIGDFERVHASSIEIGMRW